MTRLLGVAAAVVLVLLGLLWTAQGLGYVDGASGSEAQRLSLLGPLVAGFGVALGVVVVQSIRRR